MATKTGYGDEAGAAASYCSSSTVAALLTAFDLTEWFTTDQLTTRIGQLLAATKLAIDRLAQRDFEYHEDVQISVDGSGTELLPLYEQGIHDIVSISACVENDAAVSEDYYDILPITPTGGTRRGPGMLHRNTDATAFPGFTAHPGAWARGWQNIDITLTYGPSSPPDDVVDAQAMLVAARLLTECGGGAVAAGGAVHSKRLGDFQVTYSDKGPFAGVITGWLADVEGLLVAEYRGIGLRAISAKSRATVPGSG